jgi:CspA family cold shock protein
MVSGTVKWFDNRKGFGFIVGPDGNDVFVHYSAIGTDGFRTLKTGESVHYDLIDGPKGRRAENVRLATPRRAKGEKAPQAR